MDNSEDNNMEGDSSPPDPPVLNLRQRIGKLNTPRDRTPRDPTERRRIPIGSYEPPEVVIEFSKKIEGARVRSQEEKLREKAKYQAKKDADPNRPVCPPPPAPGPRPRIITDPVVGKEWDDYEAAKAIQEAYDNKLKNLTKTKKKPALPRRNWIGDATRFSRRNRSKDDSKEPIISPLDNEDMEIDEEKNKHRKSPSKLSKSCVNINKPEEEGRITRAKSSKNILNTDKQRRVSSPKTNTIRAKSCSNVNQEEAGEAIKRAKSMKNVSRVKKSNENAQQPEKPLHHPMPDLSHIGFRNISNRWASADIANSEIKSKRGSDGSNASGVSKPPSGRSTRPMSQSGRDTPTVIHRSVSQATNVEIGRLNDEILRLMKNYKRVIRMVNKGIQTTPDFSKEDVFNFVRDILESQPVPPKISIYGKMNSDNRKLIHEFYMTCQEGLYLEDLGIKISRDKNGKLEHSVCEKVSKLVEMFNTCHADTTEEELALLEMWNTFVKNGLIGICVELLHEMILEREELRETDDKFIDRSWIYGGNIIQPLDPRVFLRSFGERFERSLKDFGLTLKTNDPTPLVFVEKESKKNNRVTIKTPSNVPVKAQTNIRQLKKTKKAVVKKKKQIEESERVEDVPMYHRANLDDRFINTSFAIVCDRPTHEHFITVLGILLLHVSDMVTILPDQEFSDNAINALFLVLSDWIMTNPQIINKAHAVSLSICEQIATGSPEVFIDIQRNLIQQFNLHRYFVFPIHLSTSGSRSGGHYNVLISDKETRTFLLYDPFKCTGVVLNDANHYAQPLENMLLATNRLMENLSGQIWYGQSVDAFEFFEYITDERIPIQEDVKSCGAIIVLAAETLLVPANDLLESTRILLGSDSTHDDLRLNLFQRLLDNSDYNPGLLPPPTALQNIQQASEGMDTHDVID